MKTNPFPAYYHMKMLQARRVKAITYPGATIPMVPGALPNDPNNQPPGKPKMAYPAKVQVKEPKPKSGK